MNEKDFRNMLQVIDSMISMGEHELAKEIALKAILHFKTSSVQVENGKLKEIESELTRRYLNIAIDRRKESLLNTLINTALKTIVVLLVVSVFAGVGVSVLDKKINSITSKIESGEDRKWNQIEAAISRNPYLYYRTALIYEKRKRINKAIYQMEKALGLSPNNKLYLKKLEELKKLELESGDYADKLNK